MQDSGLFRCDIQFEPNRSLHSTLILSYVERLYNNKAKRKTEPSIGGKWSDVSSVA
jgi:hypothetical protein